MKRPDAIRYSIAPLLGGTAAAQIFGGPLTGAAMNPARVFGPAGAAGYWKAHYVYWIGPLLGGAAAGFIYRVFIERNVAPARVERR
ncbi:MAG: aquaporin [Verrucomicrobiota bacterium]|nr:aquaporin [Verrucomicrobiota bacterium]